jgi:cyanate permease
MRRRKFIVALGTVATGPLEPAIRNDGRISMARPFLIAAAATVAFPLASIAFAQQPSRFGTADEAKAMLLRAVAALVLRPGFETPG